MTFQGNPKPYTPPTQPATITRSPVAAPYSEYGGAVVKFELSGRFLVQKAKWEHRYLDQFVFSTVPLA